MAEGAVGVVLALLERTFHEGGAVDAVFEIGLVLPIEDPDEGHSVRDDQIKVIDDFAVGWVVASEGEDVGVGGGDEIGVILCLGPGGDLLDGLVVGGDGDLGADDVSGDDVRS